MKNLQQGASYRVSQIVFQESLINDLSIIYKNIANITEKKEVEIFLIGLHCKQISCLRLLCGFQKGI